MFPSPLLGVKAHRPQPPASSRSSRASCVQQSVHTHSMDYAERRVSLKHTTTTCVMLLLAARDGIFPRIDSPSTLCLCLGFMPDTLARAHKHTHTHTFHGCLDHTHLSFHPLSSIPRPANVLFFSPPFARVHRRRGHFLLSGLSAQLRCSLDSSHCAHKFISQQRALAVGCRCFFFTLE